MIAIDKSKSVSFILHQYHQGKDCKKAGENEKKKNNKQLKKTDPFEYVNNNVSIRPDPIQENSKDDSPKNRG
jgi:hypothetical protein